MSVCKRGVGHADGAVLIVGALCVLASACTSLRPFDQYLRDEQWAQAAATFRADTALMNDERALYEAGMLYGSPSRPTYDPQRARALLGRLLERFPATKYRVDATDRLSLVTAVLAAHDSAVAREQAIEVRIAELTAEMQRLHGGLDSAQTQNDVLRLRTTRLEADLRDRDEQLRALRLELKQLKEIDLKPRIPPRRPL